MAEVTCRNAHSQPVRAVARLYWPTGRYNPTTACIGDLAQQVRESVHDGLPIEVWPVGRAPENPMRWGQWRSAPDCGRCNDRGRYREGDPVTEAHCTCKRGRRMSELWYADKHGYGHPDEPEPEPDFENEPPF